MQSVGSGTPGVARKGGRKAYTLLVEMRCNSFCIFCGSRAVDPAVRRVRKELGLGTPIKVAIPEVEDLVRRSIDGTRQVALRVLGRDPEPLDAPRSQHGGFELPGALRAIERARRDGSELLSIQGGEPTIWPWLVELVAHARAIGFRDVIVVTNGRLLAERDASRRLLDAGLTGIVFSLLGADADTHDALAASTGSFAAVTQAIRHAVEYAREQPGRLHVSVNVIVSKPSLDHLADEIHLLAELGVEAANLHLVRFALFGNEPQVKARLAFPLAQVKGPLRAALDVAQSNGIEIHASDVPLCQHPWLRGSELERIIARSRSFTRHGRSPYQHYNSIRLLPRRRYRQCNECLLKSACKQAPREYLKDGGAALEPVTVATITASLESLGNGPSARARLEDISAAVVTLHAQGFIGDVELQALAAKIRSNFAELVSAAADRGDTVEALASLYGVLALRPPRVLRADARLIERARAVAASLPSVLPDGVDSYARPDEPGTRWIDFAPGLSVALEEGDGEASGAISLRHPAPAPPGDDVPGGGLVYALFMLDVFQRLRGANALRWSATNVELDGEQGWQVAWTRAAPWAVTVR